MAEVGTGAAASAAASAVAMGREAAVMDWEAAVTVKVALAMAVVATAMGVTAMVAEGKAEERGQGRRSTGSTRHTISIRTGRSRRFCCPRTNYRTVLGAERMAAMVAEGQ